ncbi:MAG: 50S ribosomal protein L15 [Oscillospiraceae bacterium]|nr:50S ribosomal protein L15 [Oscillospiraceae bacterium]
MKLHELQPAAGSVSKPKRKGRGPGSGNGKTAGKGHKGQLARSGGKGAYFEGGQLPLSRRLPKRGFNNIFSKKILTVSLSDLERFDNDAIVDEEALKNTGLIKGRYDGIKVLANGELSKKLTVRLSAYSESAKIMIEKAGGKAEVV